MSGKREGKEEEGDDYRTLSTINSLLDLLMDTSAEVDLSLKFTDDDENVEV